jgi:hypothetical protein
MSRHQNPGQNNINVDSTLFRSTEMFKYLGNTVTNQNCIHEKSTVTLNIRKACYHLIQKLATTCLLSNNVKTKYITTSPGSGTWSLNKSKEYSTN